MSPERTVAEALYTYCIAILPMTDRHALTVVPSEGSKRLKAHNLIQTETASFPSHSQVLSVIQMGEGSVYFSVPVVKVSAPPINVYRYQY